MRITVLHGTVLITVSRKLTGPERRAPLKKVSFKKWFQDNGTELLKGWLRAREDGNEEEFGDLYSSEGKPGISPVILAFVSVFQFMERLADR